MQSNLEQAGNNPERLSSWGKKIKRFSHFFFEKMIFF